MDRWDNLGGGGGKKQCDGARVCDWLVVLGFFLHRLYAQSVHLNVDHLHRPLGQRWRWRRWAPLALLPGKQEQRPLVAFSVHPHSI
jgi:hypothetical protein